MDGELAALLTSTSMPPNRSTAALTAASASSALVTFSCTTKPLPLFLLLLLRPLIGSGALTLGPLLNQLLDRSGEGGFEVDEFDPHRGDDYPDHAVVERADLGLPLDALHWGHFIAAVHLQVLLRDAVHHVQLRSTADEQDLRRVHLGVDRQRDLGVVPQRGQLRGVLRGADDDLRAVPGECDRDVAGGAVLGDVGHAEQVTSQELLADREVQDRGGLVWLHGGRSFVGVIEAGSAAPTPGTEPPSVLDIHGALISGYGPPAPPRGQTRHLRHACACSLAVSRSSPVIDGARSRSRGTGLRGVLADTTTHRACRCTDLNASIRSNAGPTQRPTLCSRRR